MHPDPLLFQPITFRSVTARNRIVVSPMCQYCATDGLGDDWHIQNLGSKAAGGAGIVFTEATHVSAIGRITPGCLGLWNEPQQAFLTRLAALIARLGAVPAMQIAHAGRKGSVTAPWLGSKPVPLAEGGWIPLAPSAIPLSDANTTPKAMSLEDIAEVITQFATTARMARQAGFKIIELHGAHGYLGHSFLSPVSNTRNDAYGGDLTGRTRFLMDTLDAIRAEWPQDLPLFVRLSCTDWIDGGLTIEDSVKIAKMLAARGDVDLIDCSSGGISPAQKIPSLYPGYQVPFAERIRAEANIRTGAVGMIRTPDHANEILANNRADLIFIARAILADPAWPMRAAKSLGVSMEWPVQYQRGVLS